ncbi:MAG TPA: UdgX family uracil-DNA binding protein [Rhodopila sp.]
MEAVQIVLRQGADLDGFRAAVRRLIAGAVSPQDVVWSGGETLFATAPPDAGPPVALPRAVADLIEHVICHRDPDRYAYLYALIWRVLHGERALLDVQSDRVVHRLEMLRKAVRRDLHKMHAFLRFRRLDDAGGERFVAWFEPDHYIVEATAGFFVDRFRGLAWSILTPVGSLHWDRERLIVGPPGKRSDVPDSDGFEAGWTQYYESTFNPARVNPALMRKEMPVRYWRNLPEAKSIARLIQTAPERVEAMIRQEAAMTIKRNPDKAVAAMADQNPRNLGELNRIIAASEPLVPGATRAVLGEGPIGAAVAFVGEQPGDQEDLEGRPFVGPAGLLLNGALAEAGIDRGSVYVTNAVKHFKFEQRGKRRMHQSPTAGEVKHYRWWLMKELEFVRPGLVVALGATAALALTGKVVTIRRNRGEAEFDGFPGYITVHPSYLLRLPDEETKRDAYAAFLRDLKRIAVLADHKKRCGERS